nr:SDR family oxidoreductase [uncultured Halomonas sp.]
MNFGLEGKLALVTGSTSGIGRAVADLLAAEGARLVVNGRTASAVNKTVAWLEEKHKTDVSNSSGSEEAVPKRFFGIVGDVATSQGAETLVRQIDAIGPLDILVNNVGFFEVKPLDELNDEDWLAMFQINVMSSVRMAKAFLPTMLTRDWGRIVFIASEQSAKPNPQMLHYAMTKAAQVSVARGLAELTKGTGVTVNSAIVAPTWTEGVEVLSGRFLNDDAPVLQGGDISVGQYDAHNR